MTKVLFCLKKNETYSFTHKCRRSSGLWNSCNFVSSALRENGIDAKQVEVQDNNSIDREVATFKPDVVIVEALWVVPEKFLVLKKLHPKTKWWVHLHSHIPFLANEGIAMAWLHKYAELGIGIISNSDDLYEAVDALYPKKKHVYLPNVYTDSMRPYREHTDKVLNVACFGAVRPMKNHLIQAIAAIEFAKEIGLVLNFHINGTRIEMGGDPVIRNLRDLFDNHQFGTLVEHGWYEREDLINVLGGFDIGMQVSLTETFSIVSADYVTAGIPMVVSDEITWAAKDNKAMDDSVTDIVRVMRNVYQNGKLVRTNQKLLKKSSDAALKMWLNWLR